MVIWKVNLPGTGLHKVLLPKGAKPLSVQMQGTVPTMWFSCNPKAKKAAKKVLVVQTGAPFKAVKGTKFLGTVQNMGYVKHVYA